MNWFAKTIFISCNLCLILLLNIQAVDGMEIHNLEKHKLEGVTLNVSWDAQGVQMNYTMKLKNTWCRVPLDDVNNIDISMSTEQDNIIVPKLPYDCWYNMSLFATNEKGMSMMKDTRMYQTRATPRAESGSNGYEAKVVLVFHPAAKYYHIIVRKLKDDENGTTMNEKFPTHLISMDDLTVYKAGSNMYITRNITEVEIRSKYVEVRIGDGQPDHMGILNAKLESSTRYTFFQRTFFNQTHHKSYGWMPVVRTKPSSAKDADSSLNDNEIAIITVGAAIGIIVIIFFIVVCCHCKYSRHYAPKPKKKPRSDPVEKQSTDPGIPVTENDFYDHVAQMKFHNFKGFYEEFTKMEVNHKSSELFRRPENNNRNRFLNVPCFDHSRVVLSPTAQDDNTYIHANYVPGYDSDRDYILTQSPLPETIKDFWNMVWQNNVTTVVMIGEMVEKGNQICAPYFPIDIDSPVTALYGEVKLNKVHRTADYVVRHLTLVGEDGVTTRKIKHLQFLSWPAVRITPACPTVFLQFMKAVNKGIGRNKDKPIVIHGTTGTGRPGIYACVDTQVRRLRKQGDVNVYTAVQDVREFRWDGVKTLDEYIFIHDTVLEHIVKKNIKDIDVEHLPHYIENSSKNSPGELFSMEYNFLAATAVSAAQKMNVASQPGNKTKNRYEHVKPFDDNRVKLEKITEGGETSCDYINASYIDTYGSKKSFIATQAPLVGTVANFWRMVYEQESWVIVMLGQEIEKGHLKADRFWPEEGYVMALGHLTVKFVSKQTDSLRDVVLRQAEIIHEKDGTKKLVQLYQYLSWPSHEGISSESIHSLVQLVHQSQLWKEKLNAKSITVVSSSGIGRPGVFIALRSLQEESEIEGSINIFQTVQKLRQQRASIIQSREEYILIYTSTMEITKHVRRKSIVSESLADFSKIGLDILPNSIDGAINSSIMERLNSVSQTSEF